MERDVLAKFEKIAANMPCGHESIVNGKLVRRDGRPNRDNCDCPGCKFRRMIARVRVDSDRRQEQKAG